MHNIYKKLPHNLKEEFFEALQETNNLKIEQMRTYG